MGRKPKLTTRQKVDEAFRLIATGALHGGVKLLREAADDVEKVAKSRDAMITKVIGDIVSGTPPEEGK